MKKFAERSRESKIWTKHGCIKKDLQTGKTLLSVGLCAIKRLISVAQFPDLVLDQPSGSTGQLIHAADAGHIFARHFYTTASQPCFVRLLLSLPHFANFFIF